MNNKYNRLFKQEVEKGTFWPSFTDRLTTILFCFMFFFIVMLVIKSSQIEEMKKTRDQLMGIRAHLMEELSDELDDSAHGIEVDEKTGAIIFDTEILFAYDDDALK